MIYLGTLQPRAIFKTSKDSIEPEEVNILEVLKKKMRHL